MAMGIMEDSVSEEEQQAKWDARTLAESEVIKGDTDRLQRASAAAEKMADEELEEAVAFKKVASIYPTMPT